MRVYRGALEVTRYADAARSAAQRCFQPDSLSAHVQRCIPVRCPLSCAHQPWHAHHSCWTLQDQGRLFRFLIHDRDANFGPFFDTVFHVMGLESVRTPYRVPQATGGAERWVRSVREECLDQLLIPGDGHLGRVLHAYPASYNERRPHQGVEQLSPAGFSPPEPHGRVVRRDVRGGLIHDDDGQAA